MTEISRDLIRVLLVDDHEVVREGLRLILETHPGFRVVGEARNRAGAIEAARREQPDVILLDLVLGAESGLDLLPELLAVAPEARVLIVTGLDDREIHHRAARLGAMGVVLKDQTPEILIKAIEKVSAGEAWFDRSMTARVLTEMMRATMADKTDPEAAKIATLSEREREVVLLICEGLKNRQIAKLLYVDEVTIRHYITSIQDKLGITDRLELVIYAFQQGLVKLPTNRPN